MSSPETWPVCICGHSRTRHARRVMPGCVSIYGECVGFGPDFKRCECPTYCHDDAHATPPAPAASAVDDDAVERAASAIYHADYFGGDTLPTLDYRKDAPFSAMAETTKAEYRLLARAAIAALRGKE